MSPKFIPGRSTFKLADCRPERNPAVVLKPFPLGFRMTERGRLRVAVKSDGCPCWRRSFWRAPRPVFFKGYAPAIAGIWGREGGG